MNGNFSVEVALVLRLARFARHSARLSHLPSVHKENGVMGFHFPAKHPATYKLVEISPLPAWTPATDSLGFLFGLPVASDFSKAS